MPPAPQRRARPNPQKLRIYYFTWQRKLCRWNELKDFEMGKYAWIVWVGPSNVITRSLVGGGQRVRVSKGHVVREAGVMVRERFEDAMLLALKTEEGP